MKILIVEMLAKDYTSGGPFRRRTTRALNEVSFEVEQGECLGIVGESGSGKTTLARTILRLEKATSGRVLFRGRDMATLIPEDLRRMRSRIQIVFQDPYASLDPRMPIGRTIAEPLVIHHDVMKMTQRQRIDRVVELLELVRLGSQHLHRYPHEFSGGQRQRIGIARALACQPELLLLDEPTSALDVSVQADVLELLGDLRARLGLTYLFISHDLAVVRQVSDRVMLLYHGDVVESGPVDDIFDRPQSDYARMLLAAMPVPDPALSPFRGRAAR